MSDAEFLYNLAMRILNTCNGEEPAIDMNDAFKVQEIANKIRAFEAKPEVVPVQLRPCTPVVADRGEK